MFDDDATECGICMAAHNPEIHDATLRIHQWFQQQVTQGFWEEVELTEEDLIALQVA